MKFMLLMRAPRDADDQFSHWPKTDIQAHIAFMIALARSLRDSGELIAAEGLAGPDQAKVVRAGAGGPVVQEGLPPQVEDLLAGYWLVDVEHEGRACEIAARASSAPGRWGAALGMPIEVRQLMGAITTDLV